MPDFANDPEIRRLLDDGRRDGDRAVAMFPNQGLHGAARAFAITHPRAIQYLEQAPALVLGVLAGGVGVRRTNVFYCRHKVVPLAERGAPLKEVMAAFGLALQLRKLKPFALAPSSYEAVSALSKIEPVVLGRIIPEKPGAQRRWLSALGAWREQHDRRNRSPDLHFEWFAEVAALSGVGPREAGDVADFCGEPGVHFNPAWRWPRAMEEATLWHAGMSVERALRSSPIRPDTQIDFGDHPDELQLVDFTFKALRTPRALAEEGAFMRHCVGTYIPDVLKGGAHIVAMRKGDERVATMELRDNRIVQLKGRFNAEPPLLVRSAAMLFAEMLKERAADAKRGGA